MESFRDVFDTKLHYVGSFNVNLQGLSVPCSSEGMNLLIILYSGEKKGTV